LEREAERGAHIGIGQRRPQITPWRTLQQPDQRRDEEHQQAEDCDRDDSCGWPGAGDAPAPGHGARKPYVCCSFCSWAGAVTNWTHASASAAFLESFNAAIGSVATTFWSVGMATPSTSLPAPFTSVT